MKKTQHILLLFMIISGFVFINDASALRFTGDAWVAQHYAYGEATDEYYLVIDDPGLDINLNRVRLKGFSFAPLESRKNPDFSLMTGAAENAGVAWLEINTENSKYFKKLTKKATRVTNKLIRKGLIDESERQDSINNWISDRLEKSQFNLTFWDANGKKYKTRIGFGTFENPVPNPDPGSGNNSAAPVPEPATMLLLGSGLVSLAFAGRKVSRKK